MDNLPLSLILEILNRLNDSADLARCRLTSKEFNSISKEVRSINLLCNVPRYHKSRSTETRAQITPFKNIVTNLVKNSWAYRIESVTVGVDRMLSLLSFDDVECDFDDLYLTDVGFVKEWLPVVCDTLRVLSILDFWIQSCWRKSETLGLISSCCHSLQELEIKSAWLSVDGLNPMPKLTSLTLEFIRLDDENLDKVNHCFPNLQVLNLIGVGGFKEPKIDLFHLKACRWTVSNAPNSLTIFAPNAAKLELKCSQPRSLILETPLLTNFHLFLEKTSEMEVKDFVDLKSLQLESPNLHSLIQSFPVVTTVKSLTLDSLKVSAPPVEMTMLSLEAIFDVFPCVRSLNLRSGAWSEMELCFLTSGLNSRIGMKGLKEITAQLEIHAVDITLSFIFSILDKCTNLSDMALLIHRGVDCNVASNLISQCTAHFPGVRWRWGKWRKCAEDTWI